MGATENWLERQRPGKYGGKDFFLWWLRGKIVGTRAAMPAGPAIKYEKNKKVKTGPNANMKGEWNPFNLANKSVGRATDEQISAEAPRDASCWEINGRIKKNILRGIGDLTFWM